jgi:hypothetical protein
MTQVESDFFIPAKKVKKTVAAIQNLAGKETIRDASGRHFSWVPQDFAEIDDPEELFRAWRWDIEATETGAIDSIQFAGTNLGDDEVFFEAIAPFVKKGSYIEMSGEDGDRWRWAFDGKTCVEKKAVISWE